MGTRRILVTGASGFIGRQVCRHLPADAELHFTSRGEKALTTGTWHGVDLREPAACEALIQKVRPHTLVHCAWNTQHGQFWEAQDNLQWLEAGVALFNAFAAHGGQRIVACGTCAEYPDAFVEPLCESQPIAPGAPATLYGQAKLALLHHLQTLDVSHAWVRIFLAYGEGEDARRLVPNVACALLSGIAAQCSSGTQLRDFMDVRDMGEAIAMLAASDVKGVVNLGSGQPATIGQVASMLGEITGKPELVQLGALPDRPGEAPVLVPDTRRQTEELGFIPRIGLRRGLEDAVSYWSTHCLP
ncbi:NAD-dependent epimerase/dehydratase family protein [Aurantiacibacter rhizosphaerae]|uniref:NAD-dependent epimerase/dehydratase family protein n=1 Tax=Aurantiacibacter rhizosphaerae TaxID=2691582 RepID=A0A844XAK5_9SPHN|nr:NAD(P)-dependent oxidoreductase [Aurantiacibacter rhizosphaerae]MWV26694.1 NAD-dependent epimerase/dehydratase family protein [Aurantiacibacter rhizosphaerae]